MGKDALGHMKVLIDSVRYGRATVDLLSGAKIVLGPISVADPRFRQLQHRAPSQAVRPLASLRRG
jgi:hypothetical protein